MSVLPSPHRPRAEAPPRARRSALLRHLVLGATLLLPLAPRGEPARAEGRVAASEGTVELMGKPVPVGERLGLPEGYLVVEEAGPEDRRTGSFTVVSPAAFAAASGAAAPVDAMVLEPVPPPPPLEAVIAAPPLPCQAERGAYLRRLLQLSGIEISDPVGLIEGLEGPGAGSRLGFYWLALATDPFRPLAWDLELRSRGEALARCLREARVARR